LIEALRVTLMGVAERLCECVRPLGNDDQMDVICHQAVAQNAEPIAVAVLAEQGEIALSIVVEQEDVLAVVAPLGDVVRDANRDHARLSRHRSIRVILPRPLAFGNCPRKAVPERPERPAFGSYRRER